MLAGGEGHACEGPRSRCEEAGVSRDGPRNVLYILYTTIVGLEWGVNSLRDVVHTQKNALYIYVHNPWCCFGVGV